METEWGGNKRRKWEGSVLPVSHMEFKGWPEYSNTVWLPEKAIGVQIQYL